MSIWGWLKDKGGDAVEWIGENVDISIGGKDDANDTAWAGVPNHNAGSPYTYPTTRPTFSGPDTSTVLLVGAGVLALVLLFFALRK